jgi:beta-glucanase (GH16 family)
MVETNYFGKGNTSSYDRAIYTTLPFAPQDDFHNYTVNWNKDMIQWIVDGNVLRTLNYAQADGNGAFFPQTPMKVSVGSWAAGDPTEPIGVRQWAQGTTDFTQGPFTMSVKQVYIQDGSTGSTYTYGDRSGSWQSIKIAT